MAENAAPGRRLRVSVTDAHGRALRGGGLGGWLAAHAPVRARGAVTVAIVSDAVMRRLNRTYRGKDYATDVLSFGGPRPSAFGPRTEDAWPCSRAQGPGPRAPVSLGDIIIATGVCRRQARRLGHSERDERRILALHGLLHLLGYDHDTDRGAMRRAEERLRRRAGLPLGLIARSRPRSKSR